MTSTGRRRRVRRSLAMTLPGDRVEPDPEGASLALALLAEAGQRVERPEEDLLGDVLGGVRVAGLVEREAVDVGHVLPVERFEGGGVVPGSLHGRPIRIERDDDRGSTQHAHSPSRTPRQSSRYRSRRAAPADPMQAHAPRPTATLRTSPLAVSRTQQRPALEVHADRPALPAGCRRSSTVTSAAGRHLRSRPAPRVEAAAPGAPVARRQARQPARPARPRDRRAASRPRDRLLIVAARSGGKSVAGQSTLTPRPTTALIQALAVRRGVSASTPPDLAQAPVADGHDVIGPLEGQAVGSRRAQQGRRPRSSMASAATAASRQACGQRQPGGPEAGRDQQRAPRRRQPAAPQAAPAGRLLVGDGEADLRPDRRPARRARRPAWKSTRAKPLQAGRCGLGDMRAVGARAGQASAAQASGVSGSSRRKVRCTARAAASSWSSAMMQVMRISEVEIMLMLMPSSASAPNIWAA